MLNYELWIMNEEYHTEYVFECVLAVGQKLKANSQWQKNVPLRHVNEDSK